MWKKEHDGAAQVSQWSVPQASYAWQFQEKFPRLAKKYIIKKKKAKLPEATRQMPSNRLSAWIRLLGLNITKDICTSK